MAVDASDAVLFQTVEGIEYPTCFLSRKLRQSEMNYSTVEKEALALITTVRAFSVYFGPQLVTIYTDHRPLELIQKKKSHNSELFRWSIELDQYSLQIRHMLRKTAFFA